MSDDKLENRASESKTICRPYTVVGIDIYMTEETAKETGVKPDLKKKIKVLETDDPLYFVARHYEITSVETRKKTTVTDLKQIPTTLEAVKATAAGTRRTVELDFYDNTTAVFLTPLKSQEIKYLLTSKEKSRIN
jgi:hypothetical protein